MREAVVAAVSGPGRSWFKGCSKGSHRFLNSRRGSGLLGRRLARIAADAPPPTPAARKRAPAIRRLCGAAVVGGKYRSWEPAITVVRAVIRPKGRRQIDRLGFQCRRVVCCPALPQQRQIIGPARCSSMPADRGDRGGGRRAASCAPRLASTLHRSPGLRAGPACI